MTTLAEPRNVIYGLFCLCHPSDGVRYVGQTSQGARMRFSAHLAMVKYREGRALPLSHQQRWIQKHGTENIAWTILEVCLNPADLEACEIRWIAQFDRLTNIMAGGAAPRGHKRSPEARAKMAGANNPMFGKDRRALMAHARSFQGPASPETRRRIAESRKGRSHTPEAIERMRVAANLSWTPERRQHYSTALSGKGNPAWGKKHTEEVRRRTSLSRTPLEPDEIREIRRLRLEHGLPYQVIADRFPGKVSANTVGQIVRGDKFDWVV